jgi:hypothetical protein
VIKMAANRPCKTRYVIRPSRQLGLPLFAIDGLDVIEGNEGGFTPLICEA